MELKIKSLKWSTGMLGAIVNKKTAEKLGIQSRDRISIKKQSPNSREIFTFVNTIGDTVKESEIVVSSETQERMGLKSGQKVDVNLAQVPSSFLYIRKKMDDKKLSQKEIDEIVTDIVNNSLSEPEIALFVSGMYENGMSFEETVFLIKAILKSGNSLKLNYKIIVDKHSIGGIPGNRTTPIVVPICAAAGLIMPKNSSRAITSAAGTADVIETIARVEFSLLELEKIVEKTNACMVFGGGWGMVPADSKILQVEKMLKLDVEALLLSSIMSKKLAVGSNNILIDIPYGKGAKIDKKKALRIKKQFEKLGRYFKRKIECVLTDGSQPIGHGIGPALELIDVINVLERKPDCPKDLEKKSLFLAGKIFELTKKSKKGQGIKLAKQILDSGRAFEKFKQIIEAQDGFLRKIRTSKFQKEIISNSSGEILEIDNKLINSLARIAGAPEDKFAGLFLCCHVGAKVKKGQTLLIIYSESKSRLKQAFNFYGQNKPIKIG